jgi:naphthalene 1,2-dioxygenase system ferredoxin subunit
MASTPPTTSARTATRGCATAFLEGHEIECPLHQGRFDVRTGKAMCAPLTEDLRSYPVKIEGGRVFLAFEG